MTSTEPTTTAAGLGTRPQAPDTAALYDAVAVEYGVIYGYGHVSAHSTAETNELVSTSMAEHRNRREAGIAMLQQRAVTPPVPAAGYELPIAVDTPDDAAKLAVRMENDTAVAWRAVLEQATDGDARAFAVGALTESAVRAARWNRELDVWPVTVAFPGGTETA